MLKKINTEAEVATESISFELSDLIILDDEVTEESVSAEVSIQQHPLLNEYRSLAKIQFVLCNSLPSVNANQAAWTYPTLRNSCKTVRNQIVNLNHELKDNQKVLKVRVGNNIIGHMLDAEIQELEQDDNGVYPLVPEKPISVIVTAFLYKRVVPDLIAMLKNGKKVKVSMECEFTDMGFLYDGAFYTRLEKPDFIGKKEFNGKPIVRVLGGIDPSGGVVNFWGCAVLSNQKPADENAEVLSAVAMEIGGDPSEYIKINNDGDDEMKKNFIERLPEDIASLLTPLLKLNNIEDLTDENIARALISQEGKIKELQEKVQDAVNSKSSDDSSEKAAITGSLEEHIELIKSSFKKKLISSGKCSDNSFIRGVLPNSVIIEEWDSKNGPELYEVQYATTDDNEVLFGLKRKVNIKYMEVVEIIEEDNEGKVSLSSTNKQGESKEMPKNKKVAISAEEATEVENVQPETATPEESAKGDDNVATEDDSSVEEIASLKTRLEELVTENRELRDQVKSLLSEKEEARRQEAVAKRKSVLSEDFDLEDLLDEEEELTLGTMTDEEFTSYAAKLKRVANKFKIKSGKTIDPGDGKTDPVGGGPKKESPNAGEMDLNVKDDVIGPGDNKKQEGQHKSIKGVASAEEETATSSNKVMPFSPEFPVNKSLKAKFGKF